MRTMTVLLLLATASFLPVNADEVGGGRCDVCLYAAPGDGGDDEVGSGKTAGVAQESGGDQVGGGFTTDDFWYWFWQQLTGR